MRAIGVLGQLEKHLGGPIACRNWNTYSGLFELLKS
jgi:hypothetical protein